jgi:hypothetical protein
MKDKLTVHERGDVINYLRSAFGSGTLRPLYLPTLRHGPRRW